MPHDLDAMQYQHAADQERELIRDAARTIGGCKHCEHWLREPVPPGSGWGVCLAMTYPGMWPGKAEHDLLARVTEGKDVVLTSPAFDCLMFEEKQTHNYPPAPPEGVGG